MPKPIPTDRTDRPRRPRLRRLSTAELTTAEVAAIRAIMVDAFGQDEDERFTDDDWDHGARWHPLRPRYRRRGRNPRLGRRTHAAYRRLGSIRTGYVEAVATAPAHQGAGYGSMVMTDATALIRERFELGCLGTGRQSFYARLGWQTWRGRSAVRTADGLIPTPDDDGYLMVLSTPSSPPFDLTDPISCAWRPGDVW